MKKIITFAIVISTFISCNNSENQETIDSTNTTSTSDANTVTEPQLIMEETFPASNNDASPSKTTSSNANPPHGQPGHRCEIPVGAPLDSEPTSPTTTINNSPNNTTTITPSFAAPAATPIATTPTTPTFSNKSEQGKSTTPPGINPPHGEPGHDCAIAVGQPLNK